MQLQCVARVSESAFACWSIAPVQHAGTPQILSTPWLVALCARSQIKVRELRHILTSLGEKISDDEMQRLEFALNLRPATAATTAITAQPDAAVPPSIPEVVEEAVDEDHGDDDDEALVKTDWLLRMLLVT